MLSPIVLDLDGDGIELRRLGKGARFDMNGDGILDETGWVGRNDGLLVIDRDNDGEIAAAAELSFGVENPAAMNDLEALAVLDNNGDRKLDGTDARFRELRVWVDANGNGRTDAGELKTLDQLGIAEISLVGEARDGQVRPGRNVVLQTGSFTRKDGRTGKLGDVALAYRPTPSPERDAAFQAMQAALRTGQTTDALTDVGVRMVDANGRGEAAETERATAGSALDANARLLALIAQDMAAFSSGYGASDRFDRASEDRPLDYFS